MQIFPVGQLSLGEWVAVRAAWDAAHAGSTISAPTEAEFDAAVLRG